MAGSTDWGVELNIRHARAALTIGIERIEELREFSVSADRIDIGAALSLSEIEARLASGPAGCRCLTSCSRSSRPG